MTWTELDPWSMLFNNVGRNSSAAKKNGDCKKTWSSAYMKAEVGSRTHCCFKLTNVDASIQFMHTTPRSTQRELVKQAGLHLPGRSDTMSSNALLEVTQSTIVSVAPALDAIYSNLFHPKLPNDESGSWRLIGLTELRRATAEDNNISSTLPLGNLPTIQSRSESILQRTIVVTRQLRMHPTARIGPEKPTRRSTRRTTRTPATTMPTGRRRPWLVRGINGRMLEIQLLNSQL